MRVNSVDVDESVILTQGNNINSFYQRPTNGISRSTNGIFFYFWGTHVQRFMISHSSVVINGSNEMY